MYSMTTHGKGEMSNLAIVMDRKLDLHIQNSQNCAKVTPDSTIEEFSNVKKQIMHRFKRNRSYT